MPGPLDGLAAIERVFLLPVSAKKYRCPNVICDHTMAAVGTNARLSHVEIQHNGACSMIRRSVLNLAILWMTTSLAQAEPIDFSALNGADAADSNGQNFTWSFGAQSGTVNVRTSWPEVHQITGALRTPVRVPASFATPFSGTVTFTFDQPVEVAVLATFDSLTRDGLDGGRFEQVRLAAPGAVQFQPAPNTTAVYSGVGTNAIVADDEFSPTPTLSIWGFTGAGATTTYELQYTGTTGGLSETFEVSVIPEPATLLMIAIGALAMVLWNRAALIARIPFCRGEAARN
jgi:hypothetical protein